MIKSASNITDKYVGRRRGKYYSSSIGDTGIFSMKILLAEHDENTARFIKYGLCDSGHDIQLAINGIDALMWGVNPDYDAIMVDKDLPLLSGLKVVNMLRLAKVDTPILMLAMNYYAVSWTEARTVGANECVFAPFPLPELEARLNAITRCGRSDDNSSFLCHGDIVIDRANRTVSRGGIAVELPTIEFAILLELIQAEGQLVTSAMLLERVWNFRFTPGTDIVSTNIGRLRKNLNAGFSHDAIETLPRVGHRIVLDA